MKRRLRFASGFAIALIVMLLFPACTRPLLDEAEMADPIDLAEPLPTVVPGSLLTPTTSSVEESVEGAYPAPGTEASAGEEAATPAATGEGQPTETPAGQQGEVVHVVQPGETLGHLAQQYDISIDEIIAANSISNPDVLEVGQQLIIPAPGAVQVQPTPELRKTGMVMRWYKNEDRGWMHDSTVERVDPKPKS